MKQKTQHIQPFGGDKTPAQLYQDRKARQSANHTDERCGIANTREWLRDRDWEEAHPKPLKANTNLKVVHSLSTPRQKRGRGEGTRSSVSSGDGNSDNSDPEPARPLLQLFDEPSLADLLCISKKSVQNLYSATPWLLPQAISIPGARGPRWTPAAIAAWLSERPAHSSTPAPAKTKGKVGRPRIAFAKQAGVRS